MVKPFSDFLKNYPSPPSQVEPPEEMAVIALYSLWNDESVERTTLDVSRHSVMSSCKWIKDNSNSYQRSFSGEYRSYMALQKVLQTSAKVQQYKVNPVCSCTIKSCCYNSNWCNTLAVFSRVASFWNPIL